MMNKNSAVCYRNFSIKVEKLLPRNTIKVDKFDAQVKLLGNNI